MNIKRSFIGVGLIAGSALFFMGVLPTYFASQIKFADTETLQAKFDAGGLGGETITQFMLYETASSLTAGECARMAITRVSGIACSDHRTKHHAGDAWTITRVTVLIPTESAWQQTEACDLDIDVGGVTIATVQLGAVGMRAVGDSISVTSFVDAVAEIGDIIRMNHDDPVPDTYCVDGVSCACANPIGPKQYDVRFYGFRN